MKIAAYWKTIVAAIAAGAIAAQAAISDNTITNGEWLAIGLAVLGAFGVWATPNRP